MSDDAPVTSKDFQKLIKAVQSTNKKLDAQAEASLGGVGGVIKERIKGIGDVIKAPFESIEAGLKAPFEAVSGTLESVGEAAMKPFESFKNVTQGFKNLFGDNEEEKDTAILNEILSEIQTQTKLLKGDKNREQNQDLKQLEQTKEQQSTFKSIADGVSNIGGVSDIPASVADETIKNTSGGIVKNIFGELLGTIGAAGLVASATIDAQAADALSEKDKKKQDIFTRTRQSLSKRLTSPLSKALGGGARPAEIVNEIPNFKLETQREDESDQVESISDISEAFLKPSDVGAATKNQTDFLGGEDLFGNVILEPMTGIIDSVESMKEDIVVALEDGNKISEDGNQLMLGNDLKKAEEQKEFKDALNKIADKDEEPGGGLPEPKKKGGILGGIMEFLKTGIAAVASGVSAFGAFVAPILAAFSKFMGVIKVAFAGLSKLALPLTIAIGAVSAIFGAIKGFKEDGFAGAIKGAFTVAFDVLVGSIAKLLGSITGGLLKLIGLEGMAITLKEGIENILTFLKMLFTTPIDIIKGLFTGDVDLIMDAISGLFKQVGKVLMSLFKAAFVTLFELPLLIGKIIKTILLDIPVAIGKGLFNAVKTLFISLPIALGKALGEGIFSLISLIPKSVIKAIKAAGESIFALGDLFIDGIKFTFDLIKKGISNAFEMVAGIPQMLIENIISAIATLGKVFLRLPLAVGAAIGALLPGGKTPGEAFTETLMGDKSTEEKSKKKQERKFGFFGNKKEEDTTAVEKVVATQEERNFTMAAERFDRSEANLKSFESEAGDDFTITERLREGGDPSDPTDFIEEKVYNDPKKQAQFERLKEVKDKALRNKSKLGGGLVKAFKEKFGKGRRAAAIANSELSQIGGREGFLEKVQNRTGAIMLGEQKDSMDRAALQQTLNEQRERTGNVVNAPTKNSVVNTTINEAPKHLDRTTNLFGPLPPGMAY